MSSKTYTRFVLGSDGSGALNWSGHIAEAALYKRRLSTTEITQVTRNLQYQYKIGTQPRVDTPLAVCVGDSITVGAYLPVGTQEYPEQMKPLLGFACNVKNVGVSGAVIATLNTGEAVKYLNTKRQHNFICIMIGTNDHTTSGSANYTALTTAISGLHALGWVVILATIPDCTTTYHASADRETYNGSIRTNWPSIADGFADVGADYRVGRTGAYADTTYFNADGIHLVGPGDKVVAQCFAAGIRQYLDLWPNTFGWTSTDNTTNVARKIPLLNNRQYTVHLRSNARRMDSGTEYMTIERSYTVFVSGGSITVGTAYNVTTDRTTLSTADAIIDASGLNLQIKNTGETGKTLQWSNWVNVVDTTI